LTSLLHKIDEYIEEYFPENKRIRPRVVKDEVWKKDAPHNAIWWTIKDREPQLPLFKSTRKNDEVNLTDDDVSDQYLGNCNCFC
jgi:hypothetical protein